MYHNHARESRLLECLAPAAAQRIPHYRNNPNPSTSGRMMRVTMPGKLFILRLLPAEYR